MRTIESKDVLLYDAVAFIEKDSRGNVAVHMRAKFDTGTPVVARENMSLNDMLNSMQPETAMVYWWIDPQYAEKVAGDLRINHERYTSDKMSEGSEAYVVPEFKGEAKVSLVKLDEPMVRKHKKTGLAIGEAFSSIWMRRNVSLTEERFMLQVQRYLDKQCMPTRPVNLAAMLGAAINQQPTTETQTKLADLG